MKAVTQKWNWTMRWKKYSINIIWAAYGLLGAPTRTVLPRMGCPGVPLSRMGWGPRIGRPGAMGGLPRGPGVPLPHDPGAPLPHNPGPPPHSLGTPLPHGLGAPLLRGLGAPLPRAPNWTVRMI